MLGLIIPTKNRSEYIIRLIRYYKKIAFPYTLYIGDSSNNKHQEALLKEIDQNKSLKINYFHYPLLGPEKTMQKLANSVKEKYSAYSGDDDFLILSGVHKAISFLESNNDYSTAHGEALMFTMEGAGVYGKITNCAPYNLGESEEETSSQRLFKFIRNYWVPQFSIHRTNEFIEAFEPFSTLTDRSFTEILCNCISIVQGKSKKLETLYLIRGVHNKRNLLQTGLSWITTKEWNPSYWIFHDTLSDMLCKKENNDPQKISENIQFAFQNYMFQVFKEAKITAPMISKTVPYREKIKQYPLLFKSLKRVNNFYKKHTEMKSLPALLSKSPYHSDFQPIFDLVTTTKE
jgi:glycosyltransferase domain-containing protein